MEDESEIDSPELIDDDDMEYTLRRFLFAKKTHGMEPKTVQKQHVSAMQTPCPLEGNTVFVSCALYACLTLSINKWRATCLRLAQVVKIGDYQATLLSMGARPKLSEAQPEPKRCIARS